MFRNSYTSDVRNILDYCDFFCKCTVIFLGFGVLVAVKMLFMVFWVQTSCILVSGYRHFGETYRFHISTFWCTLSSPFSLCIGSISSPNLPQYNALWSKLGWKYCYLLLATRTSSPYLCLFLYESLILGNWRRDKRKYNSRGRQREVKVGKGGRHLSTNKLKLEEWWLTCCRLQGIQYWFIHPETVSDRASPSQPLFSTAPPPSQSSSCWIFLLFCMVQVRIRKTIPVEEE